MRQRRLHTRAGRIALVVTVLGLSLVLSTSAAAAPPALDNPPERLYLDVNASPMPFTGTDLISGDDRALVLNDLIDGACDPLADGDQDGNPDYFLGGCSRVQMTVGHGTLVVPMSTTLGGPGEPDGLHSGGAVVESSTNDDGTGKVVNLNGTQDTLNAALADLTYEPDTDYEWNGSNFENLDLLIAHGDPAESDSLTYAVEIRVMPDNEGPTLTVPSGPFNVAASSTTLIPDPAPAVDTNGDFFVEDPDIEKFGLDDRMLLVMFTTCGEFTLRGGSFDIDDDIEDLLAFVGVPAEAIPVIMAALPSEITGLPFATGNPGDPHVALAAVGEFDEVNYGLSQVGFIAPAGAASCDLWTIITDLGHNGKPFQYVGSPIGGRDDPQPGAEIPDLGVDFDTTSFVVDGGVEVSVPATLSVPEGDSVDIPVSISGPDHPEFDFTLVASDVTATGGGVDYNSPTSPDTYPENDAGPVNVALSTVEDPTEENPDETLTVALDLVGGPAGVTLGNSTVTITILDDDSSEPTTTTTEGPTTTTESTTTTTDGSTTTTTDGSTTTTESTTTTTDGSTTTTDGSTTTTESTTTTTDGSTTTTDGSTTTTESTTTTTDGSTTTTDGSTTTTTDGSTTTTEDTGSTTTTEDPGSTTTTDPDGGGTTTSTALGGGNLTTTTTVPGGALGTGQQLPATGSDSLRIVWIATFLTVAGFGLALLSNRRRTAHEDR